MKSKRRPRGETVTVVHLWPHNEPLPEGAVHCEPPVIADHHRHYTTIIQLSNDASERGGR